MCFFEIIIIIITVITIVIISTFIILVVSFCYSKSYSNSLKIYTDEGKFF